MKQHPDKKFADLLTIIASRRCTSGPVNTNERDKNHVAIAALKILIPKGLHHLEHAIIFDRNDSPIVWNRKKHYGHCGQSCQCCRHFIPEDHSFCDSCVDYSELLHVSKEVAESMTQFYYADDKAAKSRTLRHRE